MRAMCLCIMESKHRLVAHALVFSEVCSGVQSTLNVLGANISYTNLVVFFIFLLPATFRIRTSSNIFVFAAVFSLFLVFKMTLQGVGEYVAKSLILLSTVPFYFIASRHISCNDIRSSCEKFRWLIFVVGIVYVATWLEYGTYRNASTFMILIMVFMGFQLKLGLILSPIFALLMKTQYKIWLVVSVFAVPFATFRCRWIFMFSAAIVAASAPLLLSVDGLEGTFSASEISSLGERLNEVRAFNESMSSNALHFVFGWPIGQPLSTDNLSSRGYMHSSYLWLIGTLGIPATLLFFIYVSKRAIVSSTFFFLKTLILLSNAMTFLLLTNPLTTMLLMCNDDDTHR